MLGYLAGQAAGQIVTGITNNLMARSNARQARLENYRYGEMSADNADRRARKMYMDLESPEALLEQYKKAGLSPSLMFDGGGIGGQTPTGAQGSGATGTSTQTFGIDPLNAAQIHLMEAQAKKPKQKQPQKM